MIQKRLIWQLMLSWLRFLMNKDVDGTLNACYDGELFCGFYATLTFGNITHILFLAIDDALRGQGYGSALLELISYHYPQNRIILERHNMNNNSD